MLIKRGIDHDLDNIVRIQKFATHPDLNLVIVMFVSFLTAGMDVKVDVDGDRQA